MNLHLLTIFFISIWFLCISIIFMNLIHIFVILIMYTVYFLSLVNFCEYKIAALFYSSQELTI